MKNSSQCWTFLISTVGCTMFSVGYSKNKEEKEWACSSSTGSIWGPLLWWGSSQMLYLGEGPLGFCPFLWDLIAFTHQSLLKSIVIPLCGFPCELVRENSEQSWGHLLWRHVLLFASSDLVESQETCPSHGFPCCLKAFPLFSTAAQTSVNLETLKKCLVDTEEKFCYE